MVADALNEILFYKSKIKIILQRFFTMMNSDQIIKKIINVVIIVFAVKFLISMGAFKSTGHKGTGYTITYPEGWIKVNEEIVDIGVYFNSVQDKDVVTFFPPESMNPETEEPDVHMTIVSGKLEAPSWIQDLWPDISKVIFESKVRIIDKGEIKISDQISKWVLFIEPVTKKWRLEFYVCDEKDGFVKIIYTGSREDFNKYRKAFETSKDTFLFQMGLF